MRLWQLLTPAWQRALVNQQNEIEKIDDLLKQQSQFNPARENIFRALGNSPSDFRVIIVGQDPYPDPKLATGYAFAIPVDQKYRQHCETFHENLKVTLVKKFQQI